MDYRDPNLAYDVLVGGARKVPWDVEANPILDLISLEDPVKYLFLWEMLMEGWREIGIRTLSAKNQRLCACDWAEHVLPVYEAKYPGDLRPRTAIDTARRFALWKATEKELEAAHRAAERAGDEATYWKPAYAAQAAMNAAGIVWDTQASAAGAVIAAGMDAEKRWQADVVRKYYRMEHAHS